MILPVHCLVNVENNNNNNIKPTLVGMKGTGEGFQKGSCSDKNRICSVITMIQSGCEGDITKVKEEGLREEVA